jgi:hypothetical protein
MYVRTSECSRFDGRRGERYFRAKSWQFCRLESDIPLWEVGTGNRPYCENFSRKRSVPGVRRRMPGVLGLPLSREVVTEARRNVRCE